MKPAQIDNIIYDQAVSMGINAELAKIMVAQARFESGDYTNNAYKLANNAFGYKYHPGSKWQSGQGNRSSEFGQDKSVYARYENVKDSTGEVVDWLKRRQRDGLFEINTLTTPTKYAEALKSGGYYGITASAYAKGLIAKYGLVNVVAGAGVSLILLVAIFFFIIKINQR